MYAFEQNTPFQLVSLCMYMEAVNCIRFLQLLLELQVSYVGNLYLDDKSYTITGLEWTTGLPLKLEVQHYDYLFTYVR